MAGLAGSLATGCKDKVTGINCVGSLLVAFVAVPLELATTLIPRSVEACSMKLSIGKLLISSVWLSSVEVCRKKRPNEEI